MVIERTESWVQCRCVTPSCVHHRENRGYRLVIEWAARDAEGNVLGIFDTRREALAAASS